LGARCTELVEAIPGSRLVEEDGSGRPTPARSVPVRIALREGTTTFRIAGGICRTLDEAASVYGPGTAFEWVSLLVRQGGRVARLVLEGLPADVRPFGSSTDLGTGIERPLAIQ